MLKEIKVHSEAESRRRGGRSGSRGADVDAYVDTLRVELETVRVA